MTRLLATVVLAFAAAVHAQEEPEPITNLPQLEIEELILVSVTSGSKVSQSQRESPNAVTVVTRKQIDAYDWQSINDVLYHQRGFHPAQDYDRATVGSRGVFEGWNNNHLLLLIDGLPFNDDLYGTAYTSEITPLFMVRTMEISTGPGSALYGSNATNGVVSLHTVTATGLDDKTEAQVRAGSLGTIRAHLLTGTSSSLFSVVVGYQRYQTSGNEYLSYDGSGRTGPDGRLAQFMTKDHRSSDYFVAKIDGEGMLSGLELQLHWQGWSFETGHGWLWYVPDLAENMSEGRKLASIKYKKKIGALSQEYALRYQIHDIKWNQRYFPDGTVNAFGTFPGGIWEYLDTSSNDLFGRAELAYDLPGKANALAGVEGTVFRYGGDNNHFGNYNPDYTASAGNRMVPAGPWLEWVKDHPVTNVGVYAQLLSGHLLGNLLAVTAGARYDVEFFNFTAIDEASRPVESKSFSQLSPRLALVLTPADELAVKLLAGRAFRAPAPTELFGANTWSLASNLRQLKPEIISTAEAVLDWQVRRGLLLRGNAFYNKLENQIAYSLANSNLSTNIYSLTTAGAEAELQMELAGVLAFANYSFAHRLDETILDNTIAPSPHLTTWAPEHVLNLGGAWRQGSWTASLLGHLQGNVRRRASDRFPAGAYRPDQVAAWFDLDASAGYKWREAVELKLGLLNAFDSGNRLIKNFSFPFDYRMAGRQIYASLQVRL